MFCHEKKKISQKIHIKNPNYLKARNFRDKKVSDSAFYYYKLAKDDYLQINDSIGAAESLINMAIIQTKFGDFYGSIESSLKANNLLKKENDSITRGDLASSYNNMAIASSFLYDYKKAIIFYKNAIKYTINQKNKYIYYNNLGDVLISQGNPKLAQKYLEYAIYSKDHENQSMAINNLARAKLLDNKNYDPLPEFYKALQIRRENDDLNGLNSSFATLANYYLETDKNKSLSFAKKMLETSFEINNPEDQLQALQKIIKLDKNNYLEYFQKFQKINDSVQLARSNAKNQFAYFSYGIEKKESENQQLKLKMAEENVKTIIRNVGLAALSLLLIGGFFWYRKRKKRLEQEKELEVKNTQLKMSKKVHDVVANGIYQVMTKIENQEDFSKDEALDELEFVYEKSRDISYETEDAKDEQDFSEKISSSIGSFNNDSVKTYIAGNEKNIWKNVSQPKQDEIYQIIRELLVNMKKHSQASVVSFRFEKNNNEITIHYKDNGIGMSGAAMHKNGLTNMVSRIEILKGQITFDPETEKGLKIDISFPVY